MATQAELESQISTLETILNSGANSVEVDGQKVAYDFESIRARLTELRRQLAALLNLPNPKPRVASINLGGW